MFAELGQNFAIFSKNQKLSQLLGVIAIYKSLQKAMALSMETHALEEIRKSIVHLKMH